MIYLGKVIECHIQKEKSILHSGFRMCGGSIALPLCEKASDIENIILDQSCTCLYLGLYIAWGIYLQKRVVNYKIRRCLIEIACLMVFWIFLRSIKYHILMEVFSRRMCWYLYYIPCTMIPTLGLNAAILMGEDEEKNTRVRTLALVLTAIL